ncbi:iron donor protein CyaY [Parashewanella spongiae]|uniref:Iron-sulfur cluster assembly protein CyaY n=1 Tax=Parashewanella spongiae TaxID=342950 RepID=A0A3A6TEE9_9GAMM|nr:iron donor protein CyaY [Parashewanella spongiae]MCL1079473.1 iron donor protein CyaY [Parashewanella spongiae]RJY11339.1 iron donor protein CyaY [Parashewanella spongiae]
MKMTDTEFHHRADEIFEALETAIEAAIDEQEADVDIERSGGVVYLEFENRSKIVINTQEPLHEIWLATLTGGYHFKFDNGQWFDSKNQCEFKQFVIESIAKQGDITITL